MSANRKPSSAAVLKNLPPERQAQIADRLRFKRPPEWPDNSQKAVRRWLKEDGLETSEAALSEFLSWYLVRATLQEREQKVQAWLECEKLEHPELTEEELFRRGQRKFSLISIAEEDPDAWVKIQKTQRDKEVTTLDRVKFQRETIKLFLTWSADEEAKKIATGNASTAEKTEQLGQRIFGELWE